MSEKRVYKTPQAFKNALEQRLRGLGVDFVRRRQILIYDRFLARVVQVFGDAVVLKGGLALELRLERARATKDVDLRIMGAPFSVLEQLQDASRLDLRDFMAFEVVVDPKHPHIQNDGVQYDGYRFRAMCMLAGKVYGLPFGVDVAFGDPIVRRPDSVVSKFDVLSFIGVAPPKIHLYPTETHVAEKLHAYTMPRERPNSRVKDLPDIALLAGTGEIDAALLSSAIEQTFEFRGTHEPPLKLPDPSKNWEKPYESMSRSNDLPWRTLEDVVNATRGFLDPVLGGSAKGSWDSSGWNWGS